MSLEIVLTVQTSERGSRMDAGQNSEQEETDLGDPTSLGVRKRERGSNHSEGKKRLQESG